MLFVPVQADRSAISLQTAAQKQIGLCLPLESQYRFASPKSIKYTLEIGAIRTSERGALERKLCASAGCLSGCQVARLEALPSPMVKLSGFKSLWMKSWFRHTGDLRGL